MVKIWRKDGGFLRAYFSTTVLELTIKSGRRMDGREDGRNWSLVREEVEVGSTRQRKRGPIKREGGSQQPKTKMAVQERITVEFRCFSWEESSVCELRTKLDWETGVG